MITWHLLCEEQIFLRNRIDYSGWYKDYYSAGILMYLLSKLSTLRLLVTFWNTIGQWKGSNNFDTDKDYYTVNQTAQNVTCTVEGQKEQFSLAYLKQKRTPAKAEEKPTLSSCSPAKAYMLDLSQRTSLALSSHYTTYQHRRLPQNQWPYFKSYIQYYSATSRMQSVWVLATGNHLQLIRQAAVHYNDRVTDVA